MSRDENVVRRLKQRVRHAQAMGIQVRLEVLDDQQPGWCEIGGVRTVFIDLAQTAREQLAQLDETLRGIPDRSRETPRRAA